MPNYGFHAEVRFGILLNHTSEWVFSGKFAT